MSNTYWLSKGSHENPADGRCAMEWVAFVAGEPHTACPSCVSPVLQSFCISLNDELDDARRQRLRPYLARCIGTAGDGLDERRAWMAVDWLVRMFVPVWLDVAGWHSEASELRSVAEVVGVATMHGAMLTQDPAAPAAEWADVRAAIWRLIRSTPRNAARHVLQPTVDALQLSMFDLLDRMLPTVPLAVPKLAVEARGLCEVR